ncbi:MAG: helix-turn-helix domain-containing protein [Ruminococcaceae bacterium]|nr:helix-turn-helix domain-containing protein [Oscillospiraceae bacterium]
MDNSCISYSEPTRLYAFQKKVSDANNLDDVTLHNHNTYEIFTFLDGDIKFFIEGSAYKLNPYDMLIIRNNEMHQTIHLSKKTYKRIVITVSPSFFEATNCKYYQKIFTEHRLGECNLIKAEYVKESGLFDAIERFEKYLEAENPYEDASARAALVEILYLISKSDFENSTEDMPNDIVKKIIDYLNENLAEIKSLDEIAEKFFISKCHLCRIFKTRTGITVNRYITNKRIMYVKKLCKKGKSISDASFEAGFGSYSNFYKIYIKETGLSPRDGLKYEVGN